MPRQKEVPQKLTSESAGEQVTMKRTQQRIVKFGQKTSGISEYNGANNLVDISPVVEPDSQQSEDSERLSKEEREAPTQKLQPETSNAKNSRPAAAGSKRKAAASVVEEEEVPAKDDMSAEMNKILSSFSTDIGKTLSAKKQRLEKLTSASLKMNTQKVEQSYESQKMERQKLRVDFQKQILSVFEQWALDLEKAKENEEKLTNLLRQQQKLFQQVRVIQTQRHRTIKELFDQFAQGAEELEKSHMDQQGNIQAEMKKEMALLQKRILMDTQQQEMANVKKSLQSMLF